MPGMYEIYERFAPEYDELVDREDAHGELASFIRAFAGEGARVLEAGAGTGRLTALYAPRALAATCCDRSAHMLERARRRLERWKDSLVFLVIDNMALASREDLRERFDIALEGWSFGHTISDWPEAEDATCDALLAGLRFCLAAGGRLCLIESLGTNTEGPAAPAPFLDRFYARLEDRYGLSRVLLRTDYAFPSVEEARRVCGFFFGDRMAASIRSVRVPEWTGVWTLR